MKFKLLPANLERADYAGVVVGLFLNERDNPPKAGKKCGLLGAIAKGLPLLNCVDFIESHLRLILAVSERGGRVAIRHFDDVASEVGDRNCGGKGQQDGSQEGTSHRGESILRTEGTMVPRRDQRVYQSARGFLRTLVSGGPGRLLATLAVGHLGADVRPYPSRSVPAHALNETAFSAYFGPQVAHHANTPV